VVADQLPHRGKVVQPPDRRLQGRRLAVGRLGFRQLALAKPGVALRRERLGAV